MKRALWALLAAVPVAVIVLTLFVVRDVSATPTVTCTSNTGVTRTWSASDPGGAGAGATSAASANNGSKTAPLPTINQQEAVLGAIRDGVDPVSAARQFGTVGLRGDAGAADRAAAIDPATYGWHCWPA